jgi:alkanesulfonate monooxygenase SsuD/methylene tetrahydromethanopterin reductase-like flavin-dependent oxidoreductase (luciferase family)
VVGVTRVDIQLAPTRCEWPELRDAALAAEAMGFSALWTFDHLSGAALGGDTMLECFTLLGALAEATTTIELGTLVANVWNRTPGTLVAAAASVARIAARQVHLGIGAGTSRTSAFAAEQIAVGAEIGETLADRHARVEQVLTLAAAQWTSDRDERFATFPLPSPVPSIVVGVNSVALSGIAGRHADGINVAWHHPRRDEFFSAADAEAATRSRTVERTVWTPYDRALLDPEHPTRRAMSAARIERLVLTVLGRPSDITHDITHDISEAP